MWALLIHMGKKSKTNETTGAILEYLYSVGVYAWRQNVLPVPILREGQVLGFRSGGPSGLPDIIGIVPCVLPAGGVGSGDRLFGLFLGVEIKTGKDRLRPAQIGFHSSARGAGAVILVVKDFDDFMVQWGEVVEEFELSTSRKK